MTIPNTLANLSGSIQLSLLDENFTYLDGAVETAMVGATIGATSFVNVATLVAGAGATGATGSITADSITASATVQGASFKTSAWTITGASGATGALYFAINGVNKAILDVDGNFKVVGNVTGYGTTE